MADKTGGPAFPIDEFDCEVCEFRTAGGMTMRDYFAAKAMQSLIENMPESHRVMVLDGTLGFARVSAASFCAADAMLKERDK